MYKIISIFLTVLMVIVNVYAQPVCDVKTFNLHDGLASNVITGIEQTEDQLMWFTTWSGLACYDGYRFTNYYDLPDKQKRVLTTNRLMKVKANSAGNIWVLTYDLNPYLFDRTQGRYVDIMALVKKYYNVSFYCNNVVTMKNGHSWLVSLNEGYVVCIDDYNYRSKESIRVYKQGEGLLKGKTFNWIYEDNDGEEWILTRSGIIRIKDEWRSESSYRYITQVGACMYMATEDGEIASFDKKTGRTKSMDLCMGIESLGVLKNVDERFLVATTNRGLLIYDTEKGGARMVQLPAEANVLENGRSLYDDKQGNLWMVYGDGTHLLKADLAVGLTDLSIETYAISDCMQSLKQSNQTLFHEDKNGVLWIATHAGFFGYYDKERNDMVPYSLRTDEPQPYIERWMTDRQGNLWFSNNHNLAQVRFKRRDIRFKADASEVRAVLYDRQGRLWTGFRSGKISVDGKYLGADGRLHDNPVLFSTHIYCIKQDSKGNVWIGSKGDGLYRLTLEGKFSHYTNNPADLSTICSNQIYDVHEDLQGRIWIGTFDKGISLFTENHDGSPQFKNAGSQLTRYPLRNFHKVRRITETADSIIIVSASNGMVLFKDDEEPFEDIRFYAYKHIAGDSGSLLTSDVMQSLVASDGTVYVATVGGGLQRMKSDGLKLGLQSLHLENINHQIRNCGSIFGLAEDSLGNIWVGCENSLNMYEVGKDRMWCYGPEYLGENTRLSESLPAYNSATDEMVLGTSSGTIHFKCGELQKDDFVPPLVFGGVLYHGQEKTEGILSPITGDSLEVAADRRNLTIYFAALDYQDNRMIRYAYKMEGIDKEWNVLDRERNLSWNNIPHGHHRLLVRSTNAYGTWVDNTRTLHLFVQPTFWESWIGKSLLALILTAIVILCVWIFRMRARAAMERKLDNMKLEFFSDISHKLRTPLTLIGGPVTEVLGTEKLSETAQGHLEMVKRNALRMLEMVDKMLVYSKGKHIYISDNETYDKSFGMEEQVSSDDSMLATNLTVNPVNPDSFETNTKSHLLVVEDNDDLRDFLARILESEYEVTQAVNGREGLEKARTMHPDFILTDVMMPEMDGLSMVRIIKSDVNISHIPIVILSAKASMDDRIEGLKLGVNDYITKPFSATYLKQRMNNIISNQRTLQQSYLEEIKKQIDDKDDGVKENDTELSNQSADLSADADDAFIVRLKATEIVDSDKLMMEKLMAYIDENLDKPELKIDELASAVCLGRTVFYNKVRTLVGVSPVEFLRQIRIQRAEDMVAKSNEPYSRIAYAVGFNDSRYFGKCFKAQTGLTPSEYRERSQKKK